jgi:hypothetical protein
MISIPARWSGAVRCALVLLLILEASSCGRDHGGTYPPTRKNTRPVPCDTTVTVDATNGPQPDPVYLCEGDTLTWVKGSGTNSFAIHFQNNSPFEDGGKDFDDDPKKNHDKGKSKYGPLEADKYSITINNTKTLDPQVITGGNP